jgi:acyl-CoA thioesterase I
MARNLPTLTLAILIPMLSACGGERPAASPAPPAPGAVPAQAPAPPSAAPVENVPLVAFLGDSLTAGLGLAAEEAYPALVEARMREEGIPIRALNAGVSGDTSAGGLRRVDWLLDQHPAVLVVGLGANDGLRGLPVAEVEKNLRQIVERAKAAGAKVVLLGMKIPPNYGPEYTRDFEAVYPRLAKELEVALVPFLLEGVGGVEELNQADGIHPTAEGQVKVAENVVPVLKKVLGERERT